MLIQDGPILGSDTATLCLAGFFMSLPRPPMSNLTLQRGAGDMGDTPTKFAICKHVELCGSDISKLLLDQVVNHISPLALSKAIQQPISIKLVHIDQSGVDANSWDHSGLGALHVARNCLGLAVCLHIMEVLLRHEADISTPSAKNYPRLAAKLLQLEVDANGLDSSGHPVLHAFIWNIAYSSMVDGGLLYALLQYGTDPNVIAKSLVIGRPPPFAL
ncbi:hypothetical protein FVER14953_21302 [Fusarium verticillioides]|nr:hypothetical protein FVER14953_21302 [Fusarium verticillioides]